MILRLKKNRKGIVLLAIVIFQIFLLVNMITANSYIIHQADDLIGNSTIINKGENKFKNLINSGINLLIGFLSIKQIGIVSADEESFWCCEILASNGATCQLISAGEDSLCFSDGQVWMTDCQSTDLCKTGTCIDEEAGTCSVGTKKECGDNWDAKSINEIPNCQSGCCTLQNGAYKEFMRKIKCTKEGGSFDSSTPQSECKIYTEEMGACVLDGGNCKFVTEENCVENLGGDPHPGLLCSHPDLGTNCAMPEEREIKTTCYNDKVYFLDNCSEIANVYHASKWNNPDYWRTVQSPDCGDGKKSPTCGNCDASSSKCSSSSEAGVTPTYGDYACKDLGCEDEDFKDEYGRPPKNGESWCVYESHIGDSKDVVGSQHWKMFCDKGKIKYDPLCDPYRGRICGEKTIEGDGDTFSIARCRFNEGWKGFQIEAVPYEYNEEDYSIINQEEVNEYIDECNNLFDNRIQSVGLYGKGKTCEENQICAGDICIGGIDCSKDTDCGEEEVCWGKCIPKDHCIIDGTCEQTEECEIGDFFKFDVCVPKYPPGFEFWDAESNAEDICGIINSVTCPTVWKHGLTQWECKINCECLTQEFADQMNDLCISLGDCGGYVNVEGEYTKNFKTFNINRLSSEKYKNLGDYDADGDINESKKDEYISYAAQMGEGDPPKYFSSSEEGYLGGDPLEDIEWLGEDFTFVAAIVLGAISAGLGAVAGIAYGLNLLTTAVLASTILSYITGIGLVIAAVVGAVLLILKLIFPDWGKTKEIVIEFECKPWQAPPGGDDCHKCNEGELPCTKYKCRSLGTACRLIDDDELYETENPICINKYPDDVTPPIIHLGKIDEDYKFLEEVKNEKVKIRTFDGECIQEFTPINFSLITKDEEDNNDYAKCVYNWGSVALEPPDYVLDGEYFKEGNFYSITHTFEGRLPFVSSLDSVSGDLGERQGELNMYVRCMDYAGNPNFNEYIVNFCIKEGPDNTIATIKEYIPESGSFLKYNVTESALEILLDEPADCRWTHNTDKSYENMENFTYCEDYTGEIKPSWSCTTTLEGLTNSVNNIYIKCKDQPWTEEDRNVNEQGFLYTLYSTQNPLSITSISPQGEVVGGGDIFQINLEVTTSGGMDNGISRCEYEFIKPENIGGAFFFETDSTYHKQPLSPPSGDYNISITCWDDARNTAQGNAIFNLKIDSSHPIVVRIYKEGGNLKLKTNEDAKCYYSFENCNFGFDDEGVFDMTSGFSTEHSAKWNSGQTYYIVCVDYWGNREYKEVIPSS